MNFTKTLLILSVMFVGQLVNAQTADEIITKYVENIGGKEAWSKVTSMKSTCKIKAQGMEFPAVMLNKANKMKIAFTFQGMTMVQPAFDGNVGWQTNFMTMKPEKMETEDSEIYKLETADFPDAFLKYKEKGYALELQGEETIEGTECFKLKLTKKPMIIDGKEVENATTYFFDKENFVPILTKSVQQKGEAKGLTSETVFSDYQEVNGLIMAFTIDQKFDGNTVASVAIEKIEINADIDDAEFAFPEEK